MNIQNIIKEILPFLQEYGLIVIFLGVLLEGEITIIIAGILIQQATILLGETLTVIIIAAFMSDQFWFHIGRRYGSKILNMFPILAKHKNKIQPYIKNKSDYIVLGGRFIYGTRIIGYVLLGIHDYSAKRFTIINVFVVTLWSIAGIALGYFLGTSADHIFGEIIAIEKFLLVIIITGTAWRWYRHKKIKNIEVKQRIAPKE